MTVAGAVGLRGGVRWVGTDGAGREDGGLRVEDGGWRIGSMVFVLRRAWDSHTCELNHRPLCTFAEVHAT